MVHATPWTSATAVRSYLAPLSEWRTYLYLRENPAGWITETWYCRSGCRRYFTIERNTATNEIRDSEAS